jgi:hypothetical protein
MSTATEASEHISGVERWARKIGRVLLFLVFLAGFRYVVIGGFALIGGRVLPVTFLAGALLMAPYLYLAYRQGLNDAQS